MWFFNSEKIFHMTMTVEEHLKLRPLKGMGIIASYIV